MPERIQDRLHQIEGRINQPEFMRAVARQMRSIIISLIMTRRMN
jgi:hypothetical protein